MKIDELAKETGFNKRSIYKLIHMGLLPEPLKIGLNESMFNDHHVETLKRLKQLQRERDTSQSELKDAMQPDASNGNNGEPLSTDRKRQIMDKAIVSFSKYGFENTKLSDITDSLGLGKGTFYLYFKSKRELLMECITQLSSAVVERESWGQLRNEPDFIRRQRISVSQFLKAFPAFNGIHSLLEASLQSDDPEIVEKAKGYFRILSGWLRKDLRRAIDDNAVREVNTDIVSALMLGMAQGLGIMLTVSSEYDIEQGLDAFIDLLQRGIVSAGAEQSKVTRWDITDSEGLNVELQNVLFDENPYLSAQLGQAEVHVLREKILSLRIKNGDDGCIAEVTMDNGEQRAFSVNGKSILSGEFDYGVYKIKLEKLGKITGIPQTEK